MKKKFSPIAAAGAFLSVTFGATWIAHAATPETVYELRTGQVRCFAEAKASAGHRMMDAAGLGLPASVKDARKGYLKLETPAGICWVKKGRVVTQQGVTPARDPCKLAFSGGSAQGARGAGECK